MNFRFQHVAFVGIWLGGSALGDPLHDTMIDGALTYFVEVCVAPNNLKQSIEIVLNDFSGNEILTGDQSAIKNLTEIESDDKLTSVFIFQNSEGNSGFCGIAFPSDSDKAIFSLVQKMLQTKLERETRLVVTETGPMFHFGSDLQVGLRELDNETPIKRVLVFSQYIRKD